MVCKYCHLNGHLIDKCPTIICKNCKEVGHPQWLCKLKKNKIKETKLNKTEPIKKTNSNINLENKYSFTDEIKKKDSKSDSKIDSKSDSKIDRKSDSKNDIIIKNISYYIKMQKYDWGNIITV